MDACLVCRVEFHPAYQRKEINILRKIVGQVGFIDKVTSHLEYFSISCFI